MEASYKYSTRKKVCEGRVYEVFSLHPGCQEFGFDALKSLTGSKTFHSCNPKPEQVPDVSSFVAETATCCPEGNGIGTAGPAGYSRARW
jgi:hypothetical protein